MSLSRQTIFSTSSKLSFAAKNLSRSSSARSRMTSILSLINAQRGSVAFRTGRSGFKVPRYQNTYQLYSPNPFSYITVDEILKSVMTKYLANVKYNPIVCLQLCQKIVIELRERIYKKDYIRYKFITLMTIIEKTGQGINMGLAYLWDAERDSYSKYVLEMPQFFAIGIVGGAYYE